MAAAEDRLEGDSRTVVQLVYGLFRERAQWPTFSVLDFKLDREHLIDAQAALKSIPARFVRTNRFSMGLNDLDEVRLTLQGVAVADGSADDVAMLTRFVQWVAGREQSHDGETGHRLVVTSDDAIREIGLDFESEDGRLAARRLWYLIELIPTIHSGASWSEDDPSWQMTISREVRQFRDLAGPEDLVRRVDEYSTRIETRSPNGFPGFPPIGKQVVESDPVSSVTQASPGPILRGFDLDKRLSDAVTNFELGQLDAAVTLAMKALEIGVRTAARLPTSEIGEGLMRKAFGKGAMLADPRLPESENVGRGHLFAGAILSWRNPASHRVVHFSHSQVAAEVILTVNHLLRVADQARADKDHQWPQEDQAAPDEDLKLDQLIPGG